VAAVVDVGLILLCGWLGLMSGRNLFFMAIRILAIVLTAGLISKLAFSLYAVCGATLRRKAAEEPGGWGRRLARELAHFGTLWVGMLAIVAALIMWPERLAPLLPAPEFPAPANLPVLGKADPSWRLETLDGKEVSFSSFHGRAVFLNLWATWCPPCVAEVPSIQGLHQSVKGEEVAVVLVTHEPPELVVPFVWKKGWQLPVYVARSVPEVFQTQAIPATFILNRRGEIVYQHIGSANWDTEECRQFLRGLP
jgi:thiol-disulfide isomerase/thioredoxin